MTILTESELLAAVRRHPNGAKASEIAADLGQPLERVGARLGKLAMWGRLERDWERSINSRARAVYRPKLAAANEAAMQAQADDTSNHRRFRHMEEQV